MKTAFYILIVSTLFILYLFYIYRSPVLFGDGVSNVGVARNLLKGKGFTVDFTYHYFILWPKTHHPDDNYSIFQPIVEAVSIKLLGDNLFAAKLPNILFLLTLSLSVFFIGKKLFDKTTAIFASLLIFADPLFFDLSRTPLNHAPAILFSFLSLYFISQFLKQKQIAKLLIGAVLAGISYMAKPPFAIPIFAGFYLYVLFEVWSKKQKPSLREIFIYSSFALFFFLSASPYLIRNYLTFKDPFFTAERIMVLAHKLGLDYVYLDYKLALDIFNKQQLLTIIDITRRDITLLVRFLFGGIQYPLLFLLLIYYGFKNRRYLKKDYFFRLNLYSFIFYTVLFFVLVNKVNERYYSLFKPFIVLYAAKVVTDGTRIYFKQAKNDILNSSFAWLILALLLIKMTVEPTLKTIIMEFRHPNIPERIKAYQWIDKNIPKDTVFMAKETFDFNYYTQNPVVNIPPPKGDVDFKKTLQIMKKYGVEYLFLEQLDDPQRLQLLPLYYEEPTEGFQLIYRIPHKILIYKVDLS